MKVYLLRINERCVFYSEGSETVAEDETPVPRRGLRGWAERKYQSLQEALHESEAGVGLHMRRAWEWLQRRTSPDESLLRHLRAVEVIKLYHPSSLTKEEAHALWTEYLARRLRHHIFWLAMNAVVSPLTLLLAPIPGPNVIGYWFVYRAVCHLLAVLGVRRAKSQDVVIEFLPLSALDDSFVAADDEHIAGVAARLNLKNPDAFIRHVAARVGNTRDTALRATS